MTSSSKRKHKKHRSTRLNTLELPFGYVEEGKQKSALVKVVLCNKCVKKIMWKREEDKRRRLLEAESRSTPAELSKPQELAHSDSEGGTGEEYERGERHYRRKRSSRSRSPRRRELESSSRRQRSP